VPNLGSNFWGSSVELQEGKKREEGRDQLGSKKERAAVDNIKLFKYTDRVKDRDIPLVVKGKEKGKVRFDSVSHWREEKRGQFFLSQMPKEGLWAQNGKGEKKGRAYSPS